MDGIFRELLARAARGEVPELQERPTLPTPPRRSGAPAVNTLDPHLIGLLGGLADTASTYRFLTLGTATEDNPIVAGLSDRPGLMAALGVGATAGKYGLAKLLGRKYPRLARILDANIGALQTGYGANNLLDEDTSSSSAYARALQAELERSIRAQQGRP